MVKPRFRELAVQCPTCNAGPMTPCRFRKVGRYRTHRARWDLVNEGPRTEAAR